MSPLHPTKKTLKPKPSSSKSLQSKRYCKFFFALPNTSISNYSNPLYDRLKLRQIKKIEMVDAWTQTSDRSSKGGRNNSNSITGNAAGANASANNTSATGAGGNPTV